MDQSITATYRGESRGINVASIHTIEQLVSRIASELGLVNVKLVLKGGKVFSAATDASLKQAGTQLLRQQERTELATSTYLSLGLRRRYSWI